MDYYCVISGGRSELKLLEQLQFSIVTLSPPMVYGPLIHNVEKMSDLNTSAADIYRLIDGSQQEVPQTGFWAFADVRDGKGTLSPCMTNILAHLLSDAHSQSLKLMFSHSKSRKLQDNDILSPPQHTATNRSAIS